MAFIAFVNKKEGNPYFFPACVAWVKIITSKCLQEDDSNLKGLAFFSLHPRAYITSIQWAWNNIFIQGYSFWNWTCSKAYACRAPLPIITCMVLHRALKISLESWIETALENYFQVACMIFSLSTKTREIYTLFHSKAKHTQTHTMNQQNSFLHPVSQNNVKKSLF